MNVRALLRQPVLTIALNQREARWTIGSGRRISDCGRIALPPGHCDDGVIADPDAVGRVLREAPEFRGNGRMRAVVALPAQRTVFRQLELPTLPRKQLTELAEREIRRELPMLSEHAHVSWSVTRGQGDTSLLFVVGVARDVLDSHVAAVRAAGLQPESADLRIVAAARGIGEPDCVVAYVEDGEVELGIFRGGVPSIIRYIAMAAPASDPAWPDQLAEELARTLKFYRDSHRHDDVVVTLPISFVGGAARQAMLAPQIGAATGHEVAMPPLRLQVKPEADTVVFAANVGLALKDLAA